MSEKKFVCGNCGQAVTPSYSDGRGSEPAHFTCGCDTKGEWVQDGHGGYYDPYRKPTVVEKKEKGK